MSPIFLLFLNSFLSVGHAVSTGSVVLYSVPDCKDPLFVNGEVIGTDVCVTSVAAYSYTINQRPSCANGSFATLTEYSDSGCNTRIQRVSHEPHTDGACQGNVRFEGIAFLCNGFANRDTRNGNQAFDGRGGILIEYQTGGDSADSTPLAVVMASTPSATEESSALPFPTPKMPIPVSSERSAALSRASGTDISSSSPSLSSTFVLESSFTSAAGTMTTLASTSISNTQSASQPIVATLTPSVTSAIVEATSSSAGSKSGIPLRESVAYGWSLMGVLLAIF